MKKKILIIGKNSFISLNLVSDLKKTFFIKAINFEDFFQLRKNYLLKFNYIINCSINKNYIYKKYQLKNDIDLKIAKKIMNLDINYIFLSTRKIYKIGNNLRETSKLQPKCYYSKNKLITEKKILKLLFNKVLILRISNLIGLDNKNGKRKIHSTFVKYFFENIKKGIIYENNDNYKDFLSTNQFSKIIEILIKKCSLGIFNVSIGKKVFLKEVIKWLNYYNKKEYTITKLPKNFDIENFYLNNSKLLNETKLKINLTNLEKDCKRISKIFFKK